MNKIILSIAATDPSNGAGITADLQTIRNFGCQGMGAITAVGLEQNLNQLQEIVKTGQLSLERHRAESDGQVLGNYTNQRAEYAQDFRMN